MCFVVSCLLNSSVALYFNMSIASKPKSTKSFTAKWVSNFSKASHIVSEYSSCSSASSEALEVGNKFSGRTTDDVVLQRRIRRLPNYRDLAGQEMTDFVQQLSDPDEIMCVFSHLLEDNLVEVFEAMVDDKEDDSIDLGNLPEVMAAKNREQRRHTKVGIIPLKIIVKKLERVSGKWYSVVCGLSKFCDAVYGANHVSLTVGDVLLEWGEENLVIPRRVQPCLEINADEVIDATSIVPCNIEADKHTPGDGSPLQTAAGEAEQLFTRVSEARPQIEKLSRLIAKYNTKYCYSATSRNCQGFVRDALKCFDIYFVPTGIQDGAEMIELRKKKRSDIPSDFLCHETLDVFVSGKSQMWLDELDPDSLEYLRQRYQQFHGDMHCHVPTCIAAIIEDTVRGREC